MLNACLPFPQLWYIPVSVFRKWIFIYSNITVCWFSSFPCEYCYWRGLQVQPLLASLNQFIISTKVQQWFLESGVGLFCSSAASLLDVNNQENLYNSKDSANIYVRKNAELEFLSTLQLNSNPHFVVLFPIGTSKMMSHSEPVRVASEISREK